MKEKEYIQYLIENFNSNKNISKILDDYFLDKIDFVEVTDNINSVEDDIITYMTWLKSQKIDNLLN